MLLVLLHSRWFTKQLPRRHPRYSRASIPIFLFPTRYLDCGLLRFVSYSLPSSHGHLTRYLARLRSIADQLSAYSLRQDFRTSRCSSLRAPFALTRLTHVRHLRKSTLSPLTDSKTSTDNQRVFFEVCVPKSHTQLKSSNAP